MKASVLLPLCSYKSAAYHLFCVFFLHLLSCVCWQMSTCFTIEQTGRTPLGASKRRSLAVNADQLDQHTKKSVHDFSYCHVLFLNANDFVIFIHQFYKNNFPLIVCQFLCM